MLLLEDPDEEVELVEGPRTLPSSFLFPSTFFLTISYKKEIVIF